MSFDDYPITEDNAAPRRAGGGLGAPVDEWEERADVTSIAQPGDGTDAPTVPSDSAARAHVAVAIGFLVLGLLAASVNAVQMVWPQFLGGTAFLSFGRVRPVATNALLLGWLGLGLVGAAYYVIPRLGGLRLWKEPLARANLVLGASGLLAGIVAVAAGGNQGLPFFELPWWSDVVVTLSFFVSAYIVTRTMREDEGSSAAAQWFLVAAVWWVPLALLAGAVPGLRGVNSALQYWFGFTALALLGLVGAAIGLAYYVAGRVSGRGPLGTRVSQIAFWSFAFVTAWIAPRFGVFGPLPDWLETVAIVFSFVLVVPLWAVVSDLAGSLRGAVSGPASAARRFLVTGACFLALLPVANLVEALRSPSAVVQFTGWKVAFELLVILGVASMWLFAFVYQAWAPGAVPVARAHWWFTIVGLGLALVAESAAGLQQGFTWLADARSEGVASVGQGFINSVEPMGAWHVVAAVGLVVVLGAQVLFGLMVAMRRGATEPEESAVRGPVEEPPDSNAEPARPIPTVTVVRGAVGLFVLAAVAVFLIPSLEISHRRPTARAEVLDFASGSVEAVGRDVYVREGCMYCHTQQVRPIITDVDLGPVSLPGDYALEVPPLLGSVRIGPDLTHAGARSPTDEATWVIAHLRSPRTGPGARSWSIMPSYDYLSDADLTAVGLYVSALE